MTQNSRIRKVFVTLAGGLLYAILFSFGYSMEKYGTCQIPATLIFALCLFPLTAFVLSFLLSFSINPKQQQKTNFSFIKPFIIILLCWAPMYAIMFPGVFCVDTANQLAQITLGAYNTHHPLLHTLLLKFCIDMRPLLGSLNRCAALYSLLQMILLAGCFTLTIMSISRSSSARAAKWSLLFFALHPLHMIYAVSSTKDVLFTGVFTLFLSLCVEFLSLDGQTSSTKPLAGIAFCCILSGLLRNNTIYALIVWLLILMVSFKLKHIKLTICVALSVLSTILISNTLQAALDAKSGDMREMLSWPIQQLARTRLYEEEKFTSVEKEALDALILKQKWTEYDSRISDPVKGAINSSVLFANPKQYINLYLSVGQRAPQSYLDAVIALSYPLFYPYRTYRGAFDYVEVSIDPAGFDQCFGKGRVVFNDRFSSVRDWLENHLWKTGASDIPFVNIIFNIGLFSWLVFYFVIKEAYLGNWRRFTLFLLPVLLWGTFLLGPVIYSRYAYPFLCCLPVLASRPHGE